MEYVGIINQLEEYLFTLFLLQVQHDTPFITVIVFEVEVSSLEPHGYADNRHKSPRGIAGFRLYLDNVSSKTSQ